MADEVTGDAAAETEAKPRSGRRKLLVLGGVDFVLLLGLAGGGAWYAGFLGGHPGAEEALAQAAAAEGHEASGHGGAGHGGGPPGEVVFVDMPDVLVNLQSGGQRLRFLKLRAALEVASDEVAARIESLMPRIMDGFQLYLRALTVDEVNGAGGMQRLKEELAMRVNLAVQPSRIDDVLVKEMLVQ